MADAENRLPALPTIVRATRRTPALGVPIVALVVAAASVLSYALFALVALLDPASRLDLLARVTVTTLAAIAILLAIAKLVTKRLVFVALLVPLQLAAFVLLVRTAPDVPGFAPLFSVLLIVESALYAPPRLAVGLAGMVALGGWLGPLLPVSATSVAETLPRLAVVATCGALAVGMAWYREGLVRARYDLERLENAVTQLTRASLSYQEYAQDAAERSMEEERQRITRDIHDVVGYTLTNNIMMMEAATDMIRRNPLGVTSLIEAARENAQDGLEQIRASLYRLRGQEIRGPVGLGAVSRLIRIFRQATGIDVTADFANTPQVMPQQIDSVVYHFVQEALINSFRHGRATRISVVITIHGGVLDVALEDNGRVTGPISEGIGIRGMKERAALVGGTVQHRSGPEGFTIQLFVPYGDGRTDA